MIELNELLTIEEYSCPHVSPSIVMYFVEREGLLETRLDILLTVFERCSTAINQKFKTVSLSLQLPRSPHRSLENGNDGILFKLHFNQMT